MALVANFCERVDKSCVDVNNVVRALCEDDAQRPPDFFEKKKLQLSEVREGVGVGVGEGVTPAPEPGLTRPSPRPLRGMQDKVMRKLQKEVNSKKQGGAATRTQSVKWFKEIEMKKGAGVDHRTGGFNEWFHGIITRQQSEDLLRDKPPGTFLVRVSESRFGYSLSHMYGAALLFLVLPCRVLSLRWRGSNFVEATRSVTEGGRVKHYMIDQTPDGQYQVVGNRKLFRRSSRWGGRRGGMLTGASFSLPSYAASLNALVDFHSTHNIVAQDPVALLHPCGQEGEHDDTQEFLR